MPTKKTDIKDGPQLPGFESFTEEAKRTYIDTLTDRPVHIHKADIGYDTARGILTKSTGFMSAYNTLNPYSGCSFGCTYCYAAFFSRNVEKRDTWGQWVKVKKNAVELMKALKPITPSDKPIYMSSVTDPYQPVEKKLELTRKILEILAERHEGAEDEHKPKLVVQTRSPLVTRDCDLFRKIKENGGRVQVNMTVTTDDEDIRRAFEPRCMSNKARLWAIQRVEEEGIQTCITMTPLLLVNNNRDFAVALIDTGVRKFIAQPFHFVRGKFVASTREGALAMMAEKLGCSRNEFGAEYLARYREFFEGFDERLADAGLPPLGEGKDGFAPPF